MLELPYGLNLDRNVERQRALPNRGARADPNLVAKYIAHDVRETVNDGDVLFELWRRIHQAERLDQRRDPACATCERISA